MERGPLIQQLLTIIRFSRDEVAALREAGRHDSAADDVLGTLEGLFAHETGDIVEATLSLDQVKCLCVLPSPPPLREPLLALRLEMAQADEILRRVLEATPLKV